MKIRRSSVFGGVVCLALAAAAHAAEIVGSDLEPAPIFSVGGINTVVETVQPTGDTLPLASPIDGVVVSLRIKHATVGVADVSGFRILSGTPNTFTARTDPRLPNLPWPVDMPAGIREIVPEDGAGDPQGIPIVTGERIAMSRPVFTGGAAIYLGAEESSMGAVSRSVAQDHTSGTLDYVNNFNGLGITLLLQYTVEPDADGDSYGDETQDACPGIPNPCPTPTPTNTATATATLPPGTPTPTPTATPPLLCSGQVVTIVGTSGDDVIGGSNAEDVIHGLAGNDEIAGGDGDDVICGGAGNDLIRGNKGHDVIRGNGGNDVLRGNKGNDFVKGAKGDDAVFGGRETDVIFGSDGADLVDGGEGHDICDGGAGTDVIADCEAVTDRD